MKAAFVHAPGPAASLVYGDLPTPDPAAGEVRVRVAAASVNPIDCYYRGGLVKVQLPSPYIPGCDLAGTVDAVGPGTSRFKVGDRVWGSNQGLNGRQGTLAEFACVAEDWLYPLPDGVAEADAAAVALVGITAHIGLFHRAKLTPGETVFVSGGTGGVGSVVIQMARAAGATVLTSVGSDEKATIARSLGANHVFNYKTDDVPAAVKAATGGKGADVWYETTGPGDLDPTLDAVAPWGRVVLMAGRAAKPTFTNGNFYIKGVSLVGFAMFNVPPAGQRVAATVIDQWLTAGKLRPLIGRTFPLSEAAAAHQLQEDNTLRKAGTLTGKIVVVPG